MITSDVTIIGGGVIGLSSAYELARSGLQVTLVDSRSVGQESSWAGAGMIPPAEIVSRNASYRAMVRMSAGLWPELCEELLEFTGIENEYRQCGAIFVSEKEDQSTSESTAESLRQIQTRWNSEGVVCESLSDAIDQSTVSRLSVEATKSCFLRQYAQARNPRHLQALHQACLKLGVQVLERTPIQQVEFDGPRIRKLIIDQDTIESDQFALAAGAWSGELATLFRWELPVFPIRGHIVLVQLTRPFPHIIEQGKRYLVPRLDGRLLIGSTEEEVGFDRQQNQQLLKDLLHYGRSLLPEIHEQMVEQTWCGFRPATADRLPVLGRHDEFDNLVIATGHYRAGLSLSPLTGQLVCQLVCGVETDIDLQAFHPGRFMQKI